MNTYSLRERAMLVSLKICRWQATLTDKRITREVASQHSVKEKRAGKYKKNAIDIEARTFRAVGAAATELRSTHNFLTLPWSGDGARILPAAMFEKYSHEMRVLRTAFERAAKAFITDYPGLKAAARIELNGMYQESDYPADIAEKFSVEIERRAVPNEEDFRVDLPETVVAEIKREIREDVSRTMEAAMRDPYKRLYEHISRMVTRLSDPEGIFHDTLVFGLAELCSVLPGLNITNDPQLDDLRRRAERMIVNVGPQDLRDRPPLRRNVAREAEEIQTIMAAYMGAAVVGQEEAA